jgi:hypothetical protein
VFRGDGFSEIFQTDLSNLKIFSQSSMGAPVVIPKRRVYVCVQGSKGLSSQAYLTNLIQITWPLWAHQVSPTDVFLYLCPLPGPDPFPSARAGLPRLELPPGYHKESLRTPHDVVGAVRDEMLDLLSRDDVGTVVFIYFNHGRWDFMGAPDGTFSVDNFATWATRAVANQKRLLFVMVACASTVFAQNVLTAADQALVGSEAKNKLRSSVGFLTSTTTESYSSAICVSQDANLVYLFDDPQKERGPDNLAPGYRAHNSMFGRQFLSLWTYALAATTDVTVAGFVSWMNPRPPPARRAAPAAPPASAAPSTTPPRQSPPPASGAPAGQTPATGAAPADAEAPTASVNRYGYDAAFVGDADKFGALQLNEFFPLGAIPQSTRAPHSSEPNMTFAQVIPCGVMGEFFDDMANFYDPDEEEAGFKARFVEIAMVEGRIAVVKPREPRPERLDEWLGAGHPIMRHISFHSALEGQADDTGEGDNFVPWPDLWFEFESLVHAKGWKCRNGTRKIEDLLPIFGAYLEELNGCFLPVWAFEFMCPMAAYARAQEEQDVKDLIKLAHDNLVDKFRAARASSATDAPAQPPPE